MTPLERLVLIDICRNDGTTREQVRYRLSGHSPVQVNRAIESVVLAGYAMLTSGRLEITRQGQEYLQPRAVAV